MTEYKFSNNAESTLASSIGGGDTTLTVDTGDGSLFPSTSASDGTAFFILVEQGSVKEYMSVDARSGDIMSGMIRGGSNSFAAGSTVKHVLNSAILENFIQKGVYQEYAGSPDGVLSANFTGEECLDTVNDVWYKHLSGTTWKAMTGA